MLYQTYTLSKRQHGLITLHGVKTQGTITEVKLVYERCCRVKVGCLPSKLNQNGSHFGLKLLDLTFVSDVNYTDFSWFASVPPNKAPVRTRLRTFTSVPIHYLPVVVPIDTTQCELLNPLNKSLR
jgi:hypothetical protein